MRKLLIPLLAALALPTACSNVEFSEKTVNGDLKICPENLRKVGFDIRTLDNDQSLFSVTKKISIKNALKNDFLQDHIALLKLEAAGTIAEFTYSDYERDNIAKKFSWEQVQRSIATMKEKYICIKKGSSKDEIFFIGEWSPESIKRGSKILQYHRVHAE